MIRNIIRKLVREEFNKLDVNNLNVDFWNWFAGSKAIEGGVPIVVYHATKNDIKKFSFKNSPQKLIWFTSDMQSIINKSTGAAGHDFTKELYASIVNPAGWNEYNKYGLGQLKDMGYDGALLKSSDGTFNGFVFRPNQIKSISNDGSWDPGDNNIYS